jgi:Holliday junction resolvasome RuvABC endonuclease subunit
MTSSIDLGIDPGTTTGWAVRYADGRVQSGTWNLKGGRFEGGGMRFVRIDSYIRELHGHAPISRVFFEEVRRHMGVDAAHVYGGIVGVLTAFCERENIPYLGIPVATIKKVATGKGNADKASMLSAATKRWPDQNIEDDNQADALWILEAGLQAVEPTGKKSCQVMRSS